MPKIRLTQSSKARLLALASKHEDAGFNSDQVVALVQRFHPVSTHHPNGTFADFNEVEISEIVDYLVNLLANYGFNDDYEPNILGRELENYIDQFSYGSQED